MAQYRNNEQIAVSGEELLALKQELINQFQNKYITWQGNSVLVTTVLQRIFETANGKVNIVVVNELPQTTVENTQYWVKTYQEQTLENGRYIIITDSLNTATFIGTTEADLSEYLKKTDNPNKLYGTDGDGEQQEYNILDSLATDYYYKWNKDTTNKFTKQITDGSNIDVYDIVFENGKVKTITKSATDGVIANGILTLSEVEYSHNATGDGIYLVNSDIKIINTSSLNDLLNVAGKVNDVKVAGISQVKNKEADIQTIDNVEDNWYYAFKNGSTYYYTKSKATGSTAYYQFTYTDNVLTKIENKGNATIELNANRVPQITISSTIYTLDETKNDYYIINPKQKLPSIENETRDLTEEELNRILEGLYLIPPNESWRYVGILPASNGSTLKIEDDWNELLLVMRVSEGSSYFNITSVIPKYGFTQGNPNGNITFAGFYWNESYNCKIRVGIEGTGANRVVKQNYSNQVGWVLNGTYVYKR